jgi:uncharacterized membrane protein
MKAVMVLKGLVDDAFKAIEQQSKDMELRNINIGRCLYAASLILNNLLISFNSLSLNSYDGTNL